MPICSADRVRLLDAEDEELGLGGTSRSSEDLCGLIPH